MKNDILILRKLAWEYSQIAFSDKNFENRKLHYAVNDLKMIRPVVLIDEIPWCEMDIDNQLKLQCEDNYLKEIEWFLRTNIFKSKYFRADTLFPTYLPVNKIITILGSGLSVNEEILHTNKENNIVSHGYNDILRNEDDLEKFHNQKIFYDEKETQLRYNLAGEILGDILPVKLKGYNYFHTAPWDEISSLKGVTNLLIDIIDNEAFMHKVIRKFTDNALSILEQCEALNLFDSEPLDVHCTAALSKDLEANEFNGNCKTRKNVWGRGAAQIFGSVSKEMHDEFDIQYIKDTIGQCGLVYYGCCEPLDKRIDIIEQIPNLRKIGVSPWANVNIAAEAIKNKYVLSAKPNPASVAVPILDEENLRRELNKILEAVKSNGCSCDIVLKDISTCSKRPENIFNWERIAMEMVKSF